MESPDVFDRASSSEGEEVDLVPTKKSRSEVLTVLVWTDEYRFTLINEVMAFPPLWDVEKTSYKDKQSAILLWQKVADSINSKHAQKFSARSVKKQWKNLRDSFYKRHRQMMATTGSSRDDVSTVKWKFFASMQFLLGNFDTGKRISNGSPSVSVAGSANSGTSIRCATLQSCHKDLPLDAEALSPTDLFPSRRRSSVGIDNVISRLCDRLESLENRRQEDRERDIERERESLRKKDEYEKFGEYVVSTLQRMHSQNPNYAMRAKIQLSGCLLELEENFFNS